jgi:hypothetical protein
MPRLCLRGEVLGLTAMGDGAAISTLSEGDWASLISRVNNGQCTPFLGAGMSAEKIPLGSDIAQTLARNPLYLYPLPDNRDLIKVTQYISLMIDASTPKELVANIIKEAGYPDFDKSDEPHMALASLPLPLYMTTNYDDFIFKALEKKGRDPKRFANRWHEAEQKFTGGKALDPEDINPTITSPAVYHFHGHKDDLESMVLTEDDYLDFLVRVSRDQDLIPPRIQQAIGGTSLLFIGYSLNDTNFRVIFRGLVETQKSARKISVTVQIPPNEPEVAAYLTKYFGGSGIRVYWGTARQFVNELKRRWEDAKAKGGPK